VFYCRVRNNRSDSDQGYRQRILQLSRIPVWSSGPKEKVQFPGYADLHRFSADHVLALQKSLELWWPSFWRLGNWRIVLPVPRSGQRRLAYRLRESLDQGARCVIWGIILRDFWGIILRVRADGWSIQEHLKRVRY
jgi:hypothetical protein